MRTNALTWFLLVALCYGALWMAAISNAPAPLPETRAVIYAVLGFLILGLIARWFPVLGLAGWRMLSIGVGAALSAAEIAYWHGGFQASEWMGSLAGLIGMTVGALLVPAKWQTAWFGTSVPAGE